ncbi:MAG: hypothetical protein ACYYK0_00700 [Candidatus Eutrophobiaceae bacterium]
MAYSAIVHGGFILLGNRIAASTMECHRGSETLLERRSGLARFTQSQPLIRELRGGRTYRAPPLLADILNDSAELARPR